MPIDPDFLKLNPNDQRQYLHDTDPDFRTLSPEDQNAYLSHITGPGGGIAPPAAGAPKPPATGFESISSERSEEGHKAAIAKRESQEGTLGQAAMGIGKSGGMIPFAESVPRYLSGDTERPDLTAHGTAQTIGKIGGTAAMVAPALTNPLMAARMFGGGIVGNLVGQFGSKLAGAGENAQDVWGDVGSLAGSLAGTYKPSPDSRMGRLFDVAKKEGHIPLLGKVQPYVEAWKTPRMSEGAPLPLNPESEGEATALRSMLRKRGAARIAPQVGGTASTPAIPPEDAIHGTIANPKGRMVLTPSEARAAAQMERLARIRARENGMQYAAGMRPAAGKVPARPTPTWEEEY